LRKNPKNIRTPIACILSPLSHFGNINISDEIAQNAQSMLILLGKYVFWNKKGFLEKSVLSGH